MRVSQSVILLLLMRREFILCGGYSVHILIHYSETMVIMVFELQEKDSRGLLVERAGNKHGAGVVGCCK
jgi:hypothetical protein